MKNLITISLISVLLLFSIINQLSANNIAGADLTYNYFGNNNYIVYLALYIDCSGDPAPDSVELQFQCATDTSLSFSNFLQQIPGTGINISNSPCWSFPSTCDGGSEYGVREFIYQGIFHLADSSLWNISFSSCCRNNSTNTLGSQNSLYIEAIINNLLAPTNSSPQFSNKPIMKVCKDQSYCFNHGAVDPDGDSLSYSFSPPKISASNNISYNPPYSVSNFLPSSTAITLDNIYGDICFSPSQNMTAITSVRIDEWRNINGIATLIGTTYRDIQFNIISCDNELPVLSGIDTTLSHTYNPSDTIYNITRVLNYSPIVFDINGFDPDTFNGNPQNYHVEYFIIAWNNGIPNASFTPHFNDTDSAYARFEWSPSANDISTTPHCFTATIQDRACPYMGVQTFSYCITISPPIGIETIERNNDILYISQNRPNPFARYTNIDLTLGESSEIFIEIYNLSGQKILQINKGYLHTGTHTMQIDCNNIASGIYYYTVCSEKSRITRKMIIK